MDLSDRDRWICGQVGPTLREYGIIDVYEAADGEKAVEVIAASRFDLIICDWDMPKMNGLEFLQHVRADDTTRQLPFIMLTANANREHVAQAIDAGVSDYLAKPVDMDKLLSMLRVWLYQ